MTSDVWMPRETGLWWSFLCSVAVLNIVAWLFSARWLRQRADDFPAPVYRTRQVLLWLAAGYALGCAFRSLLPLIDAPRLCLHDTALSRIFIGRSVATLAELCFAAQFALLLREAGHATRRPLLLALSITLFVLIAAAEIFSWTAVLTRNNLLHAIENSLWTVGAALALAGFASLRAQVDAPARRFLAAVLVCGGAYIVFMTVIDVPMYLARWEATLATGYPGISVHDGLRETLERCTVVREWAVWREEVPWLSLYFSAAVWISIALAHAPTLPRPAAGVAHARSGKTPRFLSPT